MRGFIDWMRNEGEEVQAKVRLPRQEHKVIEVLERDEIDRLEAAADSERDKLIVRVLADTGMRVGELVKLRDSDFGVQDRRRHYLKVRGKGSRERLVPIDAMLAGRLNRYMSRTRPADTDTDRLFLSRRRTVGVPTSRSPSRAFSRWCGTWRSGPASRNAFTRTCSGIRQRRTCCSGG